MWEHFPWYVLIIAVIDWVAVGKKWKIVEYIFKPGTMLALLFWMYQNGGLGGEMLWFTFGIIFSMAGDIFLMLPQDMFIAGLVAFLIAQVCYVIGFNSAPPYLSLWGIVFIVLIGSYAFWLFRRLAAGLVSKGKEKMKLPVLIYAVVISLMVYSALMTGYRADWTLLSAILAGIGALLFYASDSMIAWNRFVKPIAHDRLKVMSTYHLGQIGIILGAALRILL